MIFQFGLDIAQGSSTVFVGDELAVDLTGNSDVEVSLDEITADELAVALTDGSESLAITLSDDELTVSLDNGVADVDVDLTCN